MITQLAEGKRRGIMLGNLRDGRGQSWFRESGRGMDNVGTENQGQEGSHSSQNQNQ